MKTINTTAMRKLQDITLIAFIFSLCLIACKDSENDIPAIQRHDYLDEVEASIDYECYKVSISDEYDWTATKYPEWAQPLKKSGLAGQDMQVYVETYDEEPDRRDTIIVALANGSYKAIPIFQHGTLTNGANAGGAIMNDEKIRQTLGILYGVNVISNRNKMRGFKYNVQNRTPFYAPTLLEAIKETGDTTAIFYEPLFSSRSETVTGSTTKALSNQLAINAGIEVGISAFKLDVEAGYSKETSSNNRYYYAIREVQHLAGSAYIRPGMIRQLRDRNANIYQTDFRKKIYTYRSSTGKERKDAMYDLVNTYGTHFITHGILGGELKISLKMQVTEENAASNIHAAVSLSAKVVDVNGEVNASNAEEKAESNTTISLVSFGGNNAYTIETGTTFDSFRKQMDDRDKLNRWVKSIKDGTSLSLISIETMPIYELMPTQEMRDELREFIVGEYQKNEYEKEGDTYIPDLFIISGYDFISDNYGIGTLNLPEIEQSMYFERGYVPEISKTDLVTLVYSGPDNDYNLEKCFFVGNSKLKPAKITRNPKTRKITNVEEFSDLQPGAIKELFADAKGDITIVANGVMDLYTIRKVNWTALEEVNLSTIKEPLKLTSSARLRGTTQHHITLADGVNVILNGATLNGGMECEGNATIQIDDDTENSIGYDETSASTYAKKNACLRGPGSGKTMTIRGGLSGNGKLTIDLSEKDIYAAAIGSGDGDIVIRGGVITAKGGNDGGAGIGGCCKQIWNGNIHILGGTVVAEGGSCAAAIGCGSAISKHDVLTALFGRAASTCGNITLSKCNVTAKGGNNAPAIGTGSIIIPTISGTTWCKKILIKKDVVKVEVQKGANNIESIGAGLRGICDGVVIEEGANVIQK